MAKRMSGDMKILSELSRLIDCVPGAHDGTGAKSPSIGGAFSLNSDFRLVKFYVRKVINALVEGSLGFADADDPGEELAKFSEWIEARKNTGWN